MRHLLLASLVTLLSVPTARAEWEPSEVPKVAPAGCIDPIANGITAPIASGPKKIGVYRIQNGKSIDTPRLRIKAYGQFIPSRLGSSTGEVQARFEAQLLPDIKRDGENPDNSVFTTAPGVLRLLNYRISLRTVTTKPITYEALVEDIGCPEENTTPPLAAKQSQTFWMSTDGVMKQSFSLVPRYMSGDTLLLTLIPGLAPDSQQTDRANPFGHVMLHLFESRDGAPASTEWTNERLTGAKGTLLDYEVEVLRVVWGKDTALVDGKYVKQLVTKGNEPAASVLVRVTRKQVTPRGY
jgi:hypothetical protein